MPGLLYKDWKKPSKTLQIHFFCWLIFIAYEISLSGLATNYVPFIHYFLFYIINIGIFYSHSSFLIYHLSSSIVKNLWRVPLFVVIEMIIYCLFALTFSAILNKYLYHRSSDLPFLNLRSLLVAVYRAMSFVLYGTGYYFLVNYIRKRETSLTQEIENEKLKNDVLRAEQDFLRAQINPHLLFNTLSFIKYAAKKKPEEADEAVMRLSGIMGFALENNHETILVTKELEQVENIIGLNQLRYNHTLIINYHKNMQNEEAAIIPIVLLTLVENIFKHGNLLDKDHPATIIIESDESQLSIKTSNLPNRNGEVISTHKGLANIRLRMDKFYNEDYQFSYGMDDNLFKVEITINYHNNSTDSH